MGVRGTDTCFDYASRLRYASCLAMEEAQQVVVGEAGGVVAWQGRAGQLIFG